MTKLPVVVSGDSITEKEDVRVPLTEVTPEQVVTSSLTEVTVDKGEDVPMTSVESHPASNVESIARDKATSSTGENNESPGDRESSE